MSRDWPSLLAAVRCNFFDTQHTITPVRVPHRFGPLLDLVSSCTSTFTVFLLPSAFYLKLRGVRGMHPLEVAWNGLIVAFASVGAVFGTLDAIDALAKSV